jgi:type IV pilus assembly protein PilW
MKCARQPRQHRLLRQRGLTLAELMISIALGLLVVLVASVLLLSSSSSYFFQNEASQLADGGRYALEIIARAIRSAGSSNWDGGAAGDMPFRLASGDSANISGLDARKVSKDGAGIADPIEGAVNGSDVLALRYVGAGAGFDGDGSVLNCAGFGVGDASAEQDRGWSIFYVAQDADGEAELRCKYRGQNGWGSDAIVRGVDSFQVLYGLDTDAVPDAMANRYLNATAIDALDAALPLTGVDAAARLRDKNAQTNWKRVVSIKLALLLHGAIGSRPVGGSAAVNAPMQFDLFGPDYSAVGGDRGVHIDEAALAPALRGRARKLVESTILLRNPGL